MTVTAPDDARRAATTAPGWRPLNPPALADDGRFLLDHVLGRFCNPFHRINSEQDLYDETIDRVTGEPLLLADLEALECGTQAPDAMQRELGSFFAHALIDGYTQDIGRTGHLNPFRPLVSPELERHLLQIAASRCGKEIPAAARQPATPVSLTPYFSVPRPKAEHEARFRQRIENLRALRGNGLRNGADRDHLVLIIGAGPAGLIRAISATLQGLKTVVLESRPEDAPRRPQIAVIRSEAVIALLDQLGALDFLFKENRIFPFGRLKLEVSLGDLELAFTAVLRLVAADEPDRIVPDQIVQYGVVVERIDVEQGLARVVARKSGHKSDRQVLLSFTPRLIVIADGKRSPTSALLGISRRPRFRSHTGIIAIFRADAGGLSPLRRMLGALASKLSYAFHRHVSRRGAKLEAGTILQVPGHHYLGLDLTPDEEMRLRDAISNDASAELRRMLRFWSRYAFEAIRTHPKGSAPHTGGRPIAWLPLDPLLAMPIEVMSDRADVFCGHIGETFAMIEGDAQFTIHPGSAYGCAKAFLSARLFDFLLRAGLSGSDGQRRRLAQQAFLVNAELTERECNKITRFFKARA